MARLVLRYHVHMTVLGSSPSPNGRKTVLQLQQDNTTCNKAVVEIEINAPPAEPLKLNKYLMIDRLNLCKGEGKERSVGGSSVQRKMEGRKLYFCAASSVCKLHLWY